MAEGAGEKSSSRFTQRQGWKIPHSVGGREGEVHDPRIQQVVGGRPLDRIEGKR